MSKSTQEQIAEHFSKKWNLQIARRTNGDVLKQKADWESREAHQLSQKWLRKPMFDALEEALGTWFANMQAKNQSYYFGRNIIGEGKGFRC